MLPMLHHLCHLKNGDINFSPTLAAENGLQPQEGDLYTDSWASSACPELGLVIYSVFTHNYLVEHYLKNSQ